MQEDYSAYESTKFKMVYFPGNLKVKFPDFNDFEQEFGKSQTWYLEKI